MTLDFKFKGHPRPPRFAWVIWPCGDVTKHEILSEAICQHTLYQEYQLRTSYGSIWKRWYEVDTITNASYRPRGWKDTPDWTSSEGECRVRQTTRKETK